MSNAHKAQFRQGIGRINQFADQKLVQEFESIYRLILEILLDLETMEKRLLKLENP